MAPPKASISLTIWPFGETADRRVTRHLGDRVQVLGKKKRRTAQAGSGQRRLYASVTAAD